MGSQVEVVFNSKEDNRKNTYTCKLHNSLHYDTLAQEEIKKEIKDFLDFHENQGTTYTNLWDTMRAVLRGKLRALCASTLLKLGTLTRPPIAYSLRSRIDKWDLIKLQSFCKAKDTVRRTKRQPTKWEKVFTKLTSD